MVRGKTSQPKDYMALTSNRGKKLPPRHMSEAAVEVVERNSFTWKDLFFWCIIPVGLVLVLRLVVFGFYLIPSGSMKDTIHIGDRVFTTRLFTDEKHLQRGDIIVFKDPANWLKDESLLSDNLIKRLIGLPGDVVACAGFGEPITINGVAIDEHAYLPSGTEPSDFAFRVKVTPGHVFVLGDNRRFSADSRYHRNDGDHGLVPIKDITGIARGTYWPFTHAKWLDPHREVFAHVPNPTS